MKRKTNEDQANELCSQIQDLVEGFDSQTALAGVSGALLAVILSVAVDDAQGLLDEVYESMADSLEDGDEND